MKLQSSGIQYSINIRIQSSVNSLMYQHPLRINFESTRGQQTSLEQRLNISAPIAKHLHFHQGAGRPERWTHLNLCTMDWNWT